MQAVAPQLIPDLIVVLEDKRQTVPRLIVDDSAPGFLLPLIPLSLKEKGPFHARDKFLRGSPVVCVVPFGSAGCGHPRGVVKIVAPHSIQSPSPLLDRPDGFDELRFAFGDQGSPSVRRRLSRVPREVGQHMHRALVMNRVNGIESQSVHMKFVDPVAGVLNEELPDSL